MRRLAAAVALLVALPGLACGDDGGDSAPEGPALRLTSLGEFPQPMGVAAPPVEGDDLVVFGREGEIVRIPQVTAEGGADVAPMPEQAPVLDLRDRVRCCESEQGLLDATFSPDGDHLVVSYVARSGDVRVESFPYVDGTADPAAGALLIEIPQLADNHNGGDVLFDADGHLLIGVGDGGSVDEATFVESRAAAQDTGELLGSILRIAPDLESGGYDVPEDNPFVGVAGARPEIWVLGLRNPWRISLDPATGDLWVPDVGQERTEEVNVLPPGSGGANLGWAVFEGEERFLTPGERDLAELAEEQGLAPPTTLPEPEGHLRPVFTFSHDEGRCAVVGGVGVSGDRYPALDGRYVFSDFCAAELLTLHEGEGGDLVESTVDLDPQGAQMGGPVAVDVDRTGRLYVADLINSSLYVLEPT